MVDPDAWLPHYHRRIFRRRVERSGVIALNKQDYYVGYRYAGERMAVLLDAQQRLFRVLHRGEVLCTLEIRGLVGHALPFGEYLKRMMEEAHTLNRA